MNRITSVVESTTIFPTFAHEKKLTLHVDNTYVLCLRRSGAVCPPKM